MRESTWKYNVRQLKYATRKNLQALIIIYSIFLCIYMYDYADKENLFSNIVFCCTFVIIDIELRIEFGWAKVGWTRLGWRTVQ